MKFKIIIISILVKIIKLKIKFYSTISLYSKYSTSFSNYLDSLFALLAIIHISKCPYLAYAKNILKLHKFLNDLYGFKNIISFSLRFCLNIRNFVLSKNSNNFFMEKKLLILNNYF